METADGAHRYNRKVLGTFSSILARSIASSIAMLKEALCVVGLSKRQDNILSPVFLNIQAVHINVNAAFFFC